MGNTSLNIIYVTLLQDIYAIKLEVIFIDLGNILGLMVMKLGERYGSE